MTDSERIATLKNFLHLSYNKLASECGLATPQILYDIKNGKIKISKKVAEQITAKYLNISQAWLLTWEGDMLCGGVNQNNENGDNFNGEQIVLKDGDTHEFINLLKKKDEQIDRMLTIIEKMQGI